MSSQTKRSLTEAIGDVLAGPNGSMYADASPKQRLVMLRDAGHLNPVVCQAMARRFDAIVASAAEIDPEEDARAAAFYGVVQEYDEGKIRIDAASGTRTRVPHVFEVPEGESLKQTVLWLMQQGSVSRLEAQRVAAKLDAAKGDDALDVNDLAYVLYAEGCLNALPEGWNPEDTLVVKKTAAVGMTTSALPIRPKTLREHGEARFQATPIQPGESPEEWLRTQLAAAGLPADVVEGFVAQARAVVAPLSGIAVAAMSEQIDEVVGRLTGRLTAQEMAEVDAEAEEDLEVEPEPTGAEKMVAQGFTAQHLHRQNVAQVEGFVAKVDDPTVLDLLREYEKQNPSREGGRLGVLQAIDARMPDLLGDALDESEL